MFELLSNVQSVPIDQDSITMVQRGMNKVRVSVGEHNSEPSEVYIITGLLDGDLETYVIFYMLEPGIHVVYGSDENPYAPDLKEKIIDEATIFVEEMGSILEEVPWETMTREQKAAWTEKEILYSEPLIEELEEVEEIEEIEELELDDAAEDASEDMDLEDELSIDISEDVVEVSDEEVQEVMMESTSDEDYSESEEVDEEPDLDDPEEDPADEDKISSVDAANKEDVVVADGDFDEMLKQAFLKPDVVEKTRRKAKNTVVEDEEIEEVEEEQDGSDILPGDEIEDEPGDEETELFGSDEKPEREEDFETSDETVQEVEIEEDISLVEKSPVQHDTQNFDNGPVLPETDARITVIRFLSRF